MLSGQDVSAFQGDINFDLYSQNSNFVIIDATEGTSFISPKFRNSQIGARTRNMLIGYYHFSRADLGNTPETEAEFFVATVSPLINGEMLALGFEVNYGGDVVDWCKRFLDHVFSLTKVKPLIYLNQSQVKAYNWKPVVDAGYGLWIAAYIDTPPFIGPWSFAAMQQWTSSQQVPGINGLCDGDRFYGDAAAFKRYGYVHPTSPSSSPSPSRSSSTSNSTSPSSSYSKSTSPSISMSPSPSPSPEIPQPIPPPVPPEKLSQLKAVIDGQWDWFGHNAWYKRLKQLKTILYA